MGKKRRVLLVALLFVLVGGIVWLSLQIPGATLEPPVLKILGLEAADVFDDSGRMMYFVTLGISNVNSNRGQVRNIYESSVLFIKDFGPAIQAKVGNVWTPIDGDLALSEVYSGNRREKLFLFPSTATTCRISLQYTGCHPSFQRKRMKQYVGWLFGRFPHRIQSRLPRKFWMWLGWPHPYLPNADWRPVVIEMPLPSSTTTLGSMQLQPSARDK